MKKRAIPIITILATLLIVGCMADGARATTEGSIPPLQEVQVSAIMLNPNACGYLVWANELDGGGELRLEGGTVVPFQTGRAANSGLNPSGDYEFGMLHAGGGKYCPEAVDLRLLRHRYRCEKPTSSLAVNQICSRR